MIPHLECSTCILCDLLCGCYESTSAGSGLHNVVHVPFQDILSSLEGDHQCVEGLSGGGAGGSGPSVASASSRTPAVTTLAASPALSSG